MKSTSPITTAAAIKRASRTRPRLGIVLGSGFGGVTAEVRVETRIPYASLEGFPRVGVSGHSGELILGELGGTPAAVLSGRSHYYEGHSMRGVTFAVRVIAALGVTDLLLTNAAGGINRSFRPGNLMVLTDHINLMGMNPLRGPAEKGIQRFVDMTNVYDPGLQAMLRKAAKKVKISLRSGVYLAVSGPSYETPAEIRAFARLGADAVGMSTVPEATVARQCGLRVAGLSCITNLAAGRGRGKLNHAEVLETGERVKALAAKLLLNFGEIYGAKRER